MDKEEISTFAKKLQLHELEGFYTAANPQDLHLEGSYYDFSNVHTFF